MDMVSRASAFAVSTATSGCANGFTRPRVRGATAFKAAILQ